MSNVVVFGGRGFVGAALCRWFYRQGVSYTAPLLDLTGSDASSLVRKFVKDGDSVVMISAHTAEHGKAYKLTQRNIAMAASVVEGLEGVDVRHCVYVSSDSVYGDVGGVVDEDTAVLPSSLYGYMHAVRERFFSENLESLTVLRPCAIYGVGDTHGAYGVNRFVRSAKAEGMVRLFGEGEELRSNVHVDDVAAVIGRAVLGAMRGVFNVNCGKVYSFKRVAEMVCERTGARIVLEPRTVPVMHRYVDNSKLVKVFGEQRLLETGIEELVV